MAEKKVEIWHIYEEAGADNRFTTNREVVWKPLLLESCSTFEEAKKRVKELTRSDYRTCGAVGEQLITLHTEHEKQLFLDKWCFEDGLPNFSRRRFFIGKPTRKLLKNMIQNIGAQFRPI